jgi:hypothetical protein
MPTVQFNFTDVVSVPHMTRLNFRDAANRIFVGPDAENPAEVETASELESYYSYMRIMAMQEVGDYLKYSSRMLDVHTMSKPILNYSQVCVIGPDYIFDDNDVHQAAYWIYKFNMFRYEIPVFKQRLHYETNIQGADFTGLTSGSAAGVDWSKAYTTGMTLFMKYIQSGPSGEAGSGSPDFTDPNANANANGINNNGIINAEQTLEQSFLSTTASEFEFPAAGEKYFHRWDGDDYVVPTKISVDASGCISRAIRDGQYKSPAGQIRGIIKKAEFIQPPPTYARIENLYNSRINFVTYEDDLEEYILFGDKTRKEETSAFSRINVSLLFVKLKKLIGRAIRDVLFEQNDSRTRSLVSSAITQLLTKIEADGGISEYQVISDESNNTSDVIDSNQLIVDVLVKPTKSINFIKIRFTNTENI